MDKIMWCPFLLHDFKISHFSTSDENSLQNDWCTGKRVSTRPPASNTDDTTIKFQYSFMSVSKFHDLANNGTRTVLASSIILMHTRAHTQTRACARTQPVIHHHSGQGQMYDPQYGTEKHAILILGASYFYTWFS